VAEESTLKRDFAAETHTAEDACRFRQKPDCAGRGSV